MNNHYELNLAILASIVSFYILIFCLEINGPIWTKPDRDVPF